MDAIDDTKMSLWFHGRDIGERKELPELLVRPCAVAVNLFALTLKNKPSKYFNSFHYFKISN